MYSVFPNSQTLRMFLIRAVTVFLNYIIINIQLSISLV